MLNRQAIQHAFSKLMLVSLISTDANLVHVFFISVQVGSDFDVTFNVRVRFNVIDDVIQNMPM